MKRKILFNPNFIYIFSFIVPFLVYALQWSDLYPPLSAPLLLFYGFTFVVCLVMGIVTNSSRPFYYRQIREGKWNEWLLGVIYAFYFAEFLIYRNIPLIGLLKGAAVYEDVEFGIPFIHTFVVSANCFLGVFLFHQYISARSRRLFFYYLLCLLPFVLLVYRSSLMSVISSSFLVFLLNKDRISFKTVIRSTIIVLFIFFAFGYLGNLRSAGGDKTYIPQASGATDKFLNSTIPKEYYWAYLYIGSPVANLQNNIDYTTVDEGTPGQFISNECLPEFITKIFPFLAMERKDFYQINSFLNVGTIYADSFTYLRWKGMFLMFLYFIFLINVYFLAIRKSAVYGVTGLAILGNVIFFANFHNTIAYSASSLQLLYPPAFSIIRDVQLRMRWM